ncbi:MAG: hypothetical protein C5B59_00455 [Bacteroidetes bacterium]|nr:MAG: hypothetical protein C5B59_00455 [Bacteroidota bacterium]
MSLLAESLVEEWLNRKGFFTIRGIKHGVGELDLLGIHRESNGSVTGQHVEAQVSFRPVGYIAKTTKEMSKRLGIPRGSAKKRTADEVETCARQWVEQKFKSKAKQRVRESLWSGVNWSFHLVHGVAREPKELEVFKSEGVICHPFSELLDELSHRSDHSYSGSAGGDLAEIVAYYKSQEHLMV